MTSCGRLWYSTKTSTRPTLSQKTYTSSSTAKFTKGMGCKSWQLHSDFLLLNNREGCVNCLIDSGWLWGIGALMWSAIPVMCWWRSPSCASAPSDGLRLAQWTCPAFWAALPHTEFSHKWGSVYIGQSVTATGFITRWGAAHPWPIRNDIERVVCLLFAALSRQVATLCPIFCRWDWT